MAGKARVHELAKELGVTSKEVLARLNEQGEFVKSASSTVEAPVARRLRESFGGSKPSSDKTAAKTPVKAQALDKALDKAIDKAAGNGAATTAAPKPSAPGKPAAPVAKAPPVLRVPRVLRAARAWAPAPFRARPSSRPRRLPLSASRCLRS